MFRNKYIIVLLCLLAGCMALPADAQRRGRKKPAPPKVTVEELFRDYRFEEAGNMLRDQIEKALKTGSDVAALESQLEKANLGANMLRGTEKVQFVDSFKVHRKTLLQNLRMSPESGRVVASESVKAGLPFSEGMGSTAYINELDDRMFFAMQPKGKKVKNLYSAYRLDDRWSTPQVLAGLESSTVDMDNPFVMPDGVTLYYAAKGPSSLGGYDLFVTRYNASANQYLKAENMGMPFNSPANDYMLVMDEPNQLGWLVTDRNQHADTVCIYVFVPNESREVFDISSTDQQTLVRAAKISSIKECCYHAAEVKQARQRLHAILLRASSGSVSKSHYYVINDQTLYTQLKDFKSETARRLAMQADELKLQIEQMTQRYDGLVFKASQGQRSRATDDEMRSINAKLSALQAQYESLCKKMRQAEAE